MTIPFSSPLLVWLLTLPLFGCLTGCGGGYLPAPANPDTARSALREALNTWKNEGDPLTLQKQTPPIYFNDPKLASEAKLLDFEVEEGFETFGQSVRMTAKLSLKNKDGTTREKKFRYLVDTGPATVIVADGG